MSIGTRVRQLISKSANSNNSRKAVTSLSQNIGGPHLTGTGISFTNPGTIADSGNGLAIFTVGAIIEVQGSASNDRQFVVTASAAGSLTVVPDVVTTTAAGATVSITAV